MGSRFVPRKQASTVSIKHESPCRSQGTIIAGVFAVQFFRATTSLFLTVCVIYLSCARSFISTWTPSMLPSNSGMIPSYAASLSSSRGRGIVLWSVPRPTKQESLVYAPPCQQSVRSAYARKRSLSPRISPGTELWRAKLARFSSGTRI